MSLSVTDPGFAGGGMIDKKFDSSLHWGEEFEEGVSPSSLLGGVCIFHFKISHFDAHILCTFVIFHTIHADQNNTR